MKLLKKLIKPTIIALIYVFIINNWISHQAKDFAYSDIEQIPANKVGLVLGTGKYTQGGRINLYYKYRLEAAVALYKKGKIEYILVSGDNSRKDYDEPTDFKNDLMAQGVPEHKIYLDYAGFRTLDSIIRAKKVFQLHEVTIISQEFHNERALFLAKHHNLKAIAFNAKDTNRRYSIKTRFREYLAKTKASIDLLFNVQPKYLGKKIDIS